jgi:hypothetical protein
MQAGIDRSVGICLATREFNRAPQALIVRRPEHLWSMHRRWTSRHQ